jgi:hypothetical protein
MSPNIMAQQQQQQQQQYQNSYMRGLQGNLKVNNLDLINGCIDNRFDIQSSQQHVASSKQSRAKTFGQNPFNRHETKL